MNADFAMFQSMIKNARTEEGVFARFYDRAVRTGKVLENGLPEFVSKTYIEIRVRDNNDIVDRKAEKEDEMRFPVEYNRYLLEKKQMENGTPLTQFAFLDVVQLEACKYRGVFTVEMLAGLDDDKAQTIGLVEEKDLAKRFLEVSKNNQAIDDFAKKERKYKAEIKKLKEEIEALKGAK